MAVKFNDIAIALNMTLDQFFAAAAAANDEYDKTKTEIEKNPVDVHLKTDPADIEKVKKSYKKTEKEIETSPIKPALQSPNFQKIFGNYEKIREGIKKRPVTIKAVGVKDLLQQIAALGLAYGGLSQSFTSFREFQTGFANVQTLGVKNIDELKQKVIEIGVETPVPITGLVNGLYDVVSAGVDSANQISVLESSAKAAKAGLAETTDSLGLGAAVVKGYGASFKDFDSIMDKAFTTVKLGQTTFKELASEVQTVVPGFAALKINSNELFGAFATLTGVTGNASKVATQLDSITRGLLAPTSELTAAVQKQGFSTVENFAAQKGLAGILKLVRDETKGNATATRKLFADSEALKGVLALTSAQYETFAEKTKAVASETGAASDAFNIQSETLDSQLQILENRFNIVTTAVLTGAVPAISGLVGIVSSSLEAFASLDEGTQKAILGIGALTAIIFKGRAAVTALTISIRTLNASLGPAGWLILGISAAATALSIYSDNSEETAKANQKLAESNRALADSFTKVKESAIDQFKELDSDKLVEMQKLLNAELEIEKAKLGEINKALAANSEARTIESVLKEKARKDATGKEVADERTKEQAKTIIQINQAQARLAAITKIIEDRGSQETKATSEEFKKIDERKKFEFETNRITLADYVDYLQRRKDALKFALGSESQEYLKYVDNLTKLQADLAKNNIEIPPLEIKGDPSGEIDVIIAKFEELKASVSGFQIDASGNIQLTIEQFGEFQEVALGFQETSFEALQIEYSNRALLLENNLLLLDQAHGAESAAYKKEQKKREVLDVQYHAAKLKLEETGAAAALGLGSQLLNAFQGHSKTLFETGKALSITNTIITTYEAVARAYKDYPFPFNIAVSGIQGALGFAQVKKIQSAKFQPPKKGKALGGVIEDADFLRAVLPLPPGEDGYIAVKRNEFVVNEAATREFFPLLNAINRRNGNVPSPTKSHAYQGGGVVNNVLQPTVPSNNNSIENIGEIVKDAIVEGFRRSTLRVKGDFRARGREIQSAIDKEEDLTTEL